MARQKNKQGRQATPILHPQWRETVLTRVVDPEASWETGQRLEIAKKHTPG